MSDTKISNDIAVFGIAMKRWFFSPKQWDVLTSGEKIRWIPASEDERNALPLLLKYPKWQNFSYEEDDGSFLIWLKEVRDTE